MDTSGKTHFWTAAFGLVAAIVTLLAAIGGTAGFFQGSSTTAGGQSSASGEPTGASAPSPTPSPEAGAVKATPSPSPMVWRQGTLQVPVEGESAGYAADFDTGELIRVESAADVREADVAARDDGHDVVLEPGIDGSGASTFYARFGAVNDEAAGRNGCAADGTPPAPSTRLVLFTDVEVGSHVCLVTSRGRIAELEITATKLNGKQRWIELRYTTWTN